MANDMYDNEMTDKEMLARYSIQLRDYQKLAADIVETEFNRGINPQLIELPTGTGKTVVLGEIAKRRLQFGRILFVVHRQEILYQTVRSFEKTTGLTAGIVMADVREYNEEIVCASIQTLANGQHMDNVLANPVGTVFIDEVHHYTPNSIYARLLEQVREKYSSALILGVSATPFRLDKVRIEETFRPVFSRSIQEMQSANWLAKSLWRPIYIDNMRLDGITSRIKDGERDFTVEELSAAMLPHATEMANKSLVEMGDRQTAVFAVSIPHMWALREAYNNLGIKVEVVYGDQDKTERRNIIRDWKAEKIQVVINVGVLTEGFDYPEISCLVMARPTQSPSLYTQMLGRGLRVLDGKEDCIIIDFTGHPIMDDEPSPNITLPDIMGIKGDGTDQATEYKIRLFKKWSKIALVDMNTPDVLIVGTEIGTFGIARNESTGLWDVIRIVDDNTIRILNKNLGYTQSGAAEKLTVILERMGATQTLWRTRSQWRRQQPSEKQMNYLQRMSPSAFQKAYENGWSKGDVANAITRARYSNTVRRWKKGRAKNV